MKRNAFTLIELLVVIAIIALLLSIIMPAIKLAKKKAMELYSISNMRSLAAVWYMYQGENDSKLVSGQVYANNSVNTRPPDQRPNGVRSYDWAHPVNPALPISDHDKELAGIRKGALWPYVEETKVYHSPADRTWNKTTRAYTSTFYL